MLLDGDTQPRGIAAYGVLNAGSTLYFDREKISGFGIQCRTSQIPSFSGDVYVWGHFGLHTLTGVAPETNNNIWYFPFENFLLTNIGLVK